MTEIKNKNYYNNATIINLLEIVVLVALAYCFGFIGDDNTTDRIEILRPNFRSLPQDDISLLLRASNGCKNRITKGNKKIIQDCFQEGAKDELSIEEHQKLNHILAK